MLSHFQKPISMGEATAVSWNVTVLMKGHTPCLFSSLFKHFFQNRVFDWQLQHLGREFELNFVPGGEVEI